MDIFAKSLAAAKKYLQNTPQIKKEANMALYANTPKIGNNLADYIQNMHTNNSFFEDSQVIVCTNINYHYITNDNNIFTNDNFLNFAA